MGRMGFRVWRFRDYMAFGLGTVLPMRSLHRHLWGNSMLGLGFRVLGF